MINADEKNLLSEIKKPSSPEFADQTAKVAKLKSEKEALELKYNDLCAAENKELLKIERKSHETLEFYNRITMFESFYNDMWEKPGYPDLETISKRFSHLLIVEDNEESFGDFTHSNNSFLKEQIQSRTHANTFAVGLGQSLGVVIESG